MIEIGGLRKTYRSRKRAVIAVDGVDLSVGEGEVYGVLGQSGAGKSTLLRCVNMLERPDAGTVSVDGRELTKLRRKDLRIARQGIGMIHQHFALLSSRTVAGNVAFALEVTGTPRAERKARVAELLDLVGLGERADAYPAQLSGGQKQRVGIARALAARPKVLLSDEATSALDPETTESILRLLLDLNRRLGLTVLLITHEMTVVKRICTSAAVMRDGRFVESGTIADLLRRPDSELARDLFPLEPRVPLEPGVSPTSGGSPTFGGSGGTTSDSTTSDSTTSHGTTIVDITVSGADADEPIIADLARRFEIDVRILGGSVETLAATRAGRWRLALPGSPDANRAALDYLRKRGVTA
ncbi:methionine ABC transporter ATP-binding protein [Actinoplanes derwentensis]|uniref:D-methionine transport system ATP-binding protein n=1 Tax=Actinoplanes derwentensis TaxID=113562 RepID=A0A1H1PLS1_9ACTN|nr:ATP-binding cassette domain-containing protein [Actinoplanes derwentensis]GID90330.1 methionine import ATP-binding protein MetN [Actinoplanes derwentensis]SDS12211.1 D-methionine transport system ATP-binding protein [Actinoplanes derwentensis]